MMHEYLRTIVLLTATWPEESPAVALELTEFQSWEGPSPVGSNFLILRMRKLTK